jgi:hypothetical protein
MGVGKQGHAFFGGCCDMRRAVIIVNIISVTFTSLSLVTILMAASKTVSRDMSAFSYDDDEVQEAMPNFIEAKPAVGVFFALTAIRIVANGLGIYGAVT